ncbi:phosphoribosyltransferase [Bowmanella dokdonensis]|uniref:Phosphoribosyltransferase n=1 Tax=Bowmanella dokdonensis TaxID=751969 RepID=A0A939DMR7_9ALTE|nr:phosphoribosyltransferase [Bowmanella dokdonensis]MBN7824636.1 phosphoribosyltransferase [Bowmanella dokdonensis]
MQALISDRRSAGRRLAEHLQDYRQRDDLLVLGLPRGGIPVAFEVAKALCAPLDVMLVRKLGLPLHEEYAMGAIASGGVRILNEAVISYYGIDAEAIEGVVIREQQELARREKVYRGERPWPDLRRHCVLLVDDGLATGATMQAAVEAVRRQGASELVVAVPLAARDSLQALGKLVDNLVCLHSPTPFQSVGQWYENFDQTSDAEVLELLSQARTLQPYQAAGR